MSEPQHPHLSEQTRRILEERARRLAQPVISVSSSETTVELMVVSVANETYGIEAKYVTEVLRGAEVASLPCVPEYVAGVVNLRGVLLALFDLRIVLGLRGDRPPGGGRVLVIGTNKPEFGLLVDDVTDFAFVNLSEIAAAERPKNADEAQLIKGITPSAMIILDGTALMSDRRLFVGNDSIASENHQEGD